jgi:hypothetical protein
VSDPKTGEIWSCREYGLGVAWLVLAVVLLVVPFFLCPSTEGCASSERPILRALPWALGGGLLGALLSVLSIRRHLKGSACRLT